MATLNSYATLTEFKEWKEITGTDATRDSDVEKILEDASRYIDDQTVRTFYPRIETHYFDVPDARTLRLDDDLLEVISVTNGDSTSLSSTEYNLEPRNKTPYFQITIKNFSAYRWMFSPTSGSEYVIGINGVWGFHDRYSQRAWKSVGTLGAAISDTTTAAFTMTGGHSIAAGRVYKIDSELFNVTVVSTNAITTHQRGDNGSTAATHINGATVYEWQVLPDIKKLCLELAHASYTRRFGESASYTTTITAAGVVLSPRDLSKQAENKMLFYRKRS